MEERAAHRCRLYHDRLDGAKPIGNEATATDDIIPYFIICYAARLSIRRICVASQWACAVEEFEDAREIDHGWAAFNIETDGNQFDFEVALGATVSGLREPESTVVVLHKLSDSATCRVSIQSGPRAHGKNRVVVRRLEVLSPVLSEDLAELDCAAECVSQLTRSLMLYRPIPFRIVRWDRSRLPRPPMPRDSEGVYNLSGHELRSFLTFSRHLMSLHVSRNLFDHARYLPADLDDDVRTLLGAQGRKKGAFWRMRHI
jgi:hypothetical protein